MRFEELGLAEPILRAVLAEGYTIPTPIQLQAIPHALAGRDLFGCAQTGTGKTAAFALPIIQKLYHTGGSHPRIRPIRALILAPTRELASQIGESFRAYGRHTGLRGIVIFGGVNQNPQTNSLRAGADIVVATPGRLLDLMNQGYVDLKSIEVLVLDEADHMLDMGFIHDIRKIVAKVPTKRQSLFFSATMPTEIRKLADTILVNPVSVQVAAVSATADNVEQSLYHVKKKNKPVLLAHLLSHTSFTRSLVFTRTKHGANKVVRDLEKAGIACEAIHGNKSQSARERAIENFKSYKTHVLVATDIAARGLDIDDISHVVNFDLPNVPETYVHRIGRTARAGASGVAVSFCDPDERLHLKAIERLTRKAIPVVEDHPDYPATSESHDSHERPARPPQRFQRQGQSSQRNQTRRPKPATPSSRVDRPSRSHGAPRNADAMPPRREARPARSSNQGGVQIESHTVEGAPPAQRNRSAYGPGHKRRRAAAAHTTTTQGRTDQPSTNHPPSKDGAAKPQAQRPQRDNTHHQSAKAPPKPGRQSHANAQGNTGQSSAEGRNQNGPPKPGRNKRRRSRGPKR